MKELFLLGILFFVAGLLIRVFKGEQTKVNNKEYKYIPLPSPMTDTEYKFYKILKEITNKYNLNILPQVQLQSIFKTDNYSAFNKIKAKSIDFAIVDNECKYKMFIELDDYSHNKEKRKERDKFVNKIFLDNNLKLIRIKVNNYYDINFIESKIKEVV